MTASYFLRIWRVIRVLAHVFGAFHTIKHQFPRLDVQQRERLARAWAEKLLSILGVNLRVMGEPPPPGTLVVANHISWLDVYLLNAVKPLRFVSKAEVRDWPVLGSLAEKAGTLFMERLRPSAVISINRQLGEILAAGGCVGVFPEGTTTWGDRVLHFHGALLEPAVKTGAIIQPVVLRYLDAQGQPCKAAAYADHLSFGASLWRIVSQKSIHAELRLLAPMVTIGSNRRVLAQAAEAAIRSEHGALG